MSNFTVEHLGEDRLAQAWPILRAAGAESIPEWWENEARALIGRGGGVLVARTADGSIHGIVTFERAEGAPEITRLITFELNRKEPVKHALCDALDLLAIRDSNGRRNDLDVCA